MIKRKLGIVFGMMLVFSLIGAFLIRAYGRKPGEDGRNQGENEEKLIAASFYPVCVIVKNLMMKSEGVRLVNLTENHAGCLHDYQLTTKDMATLEKADLLVLNGGGMEEFLQEAVLGFTHLAIVDSCAGMELLTVAAHDHEGAEYPEEVGAGYPETGAEYPKEGAEYPETGAEIGVEKTVENGHVWMDFDRYQMQIRTIADALCRFDPQNAASYRKNEENYLGKVRALQEEYRAALELSEMEVIIFHDAFYYLCEELGMDVVHGMDLDADTALNAGEMAEIADEIGRHGVRYLLAEEGNEAIANQIAKNSGCQVLSLDPLTFGEMDEDAYLNGMRKNLEQLCKIKR